MSHNAASHGATSSDRHTSLGNGDRSDGRPAHESRNGEQRDSRRYSRSHSDGQARGHSRTHGDTHSDGHNSAHNEPRNDNRDAKKQYRDCACGRGMKCTGMTQAFRMLGDPRCHYVELPRYRSNPPAYKYVFRNNLRAAYVRHLEKDNESIGADAFSSNPSKRRYVALHHFHPHVVKTFYDNPLASARRHKVPISITEYEMQALGIERREEDRILSMSGKPTGGYYFVPHYKFEAAHEDLKELIKEQRLIQMEAQREAKEAKHRRAEERKQRKLMQRRQEQQQQEHEREEQRQQMQQQMEREQQIQRQIQQGQQGQQEQHQPQEINSKEPPTDMEILSSTSRTTTTTTSAPAASGTPTKQATPATPQDQSATTQPPQQRSSLQAEQPQAPTIGSPSSTEDGASSPTDATPVQQQAAQQRQVKEQEDQQQQVLPDQQIMQSLASVAAATDGIMHHTDADVDADATAVDDHTRGIVKEIVSEQLADTGTEDGEIQSEDVQMPQSAVADNAPMQSEDTLNGDDRSPHIVVVDSETQTNVDAHSAVNHIGNAHAHVSGFGDDDDEGDDFDKLWNDEKDDSQAGIEVTPAPPAYDKTDEDGQNESEQRSSHGLPEILDVASERMDSVQSHSVAVKQDEPPLGETDQSEMQHPGDGANNQAKMSDELHSLGEHEQEEAKPGEDEDEDDEVENSKHIIDAHSPILSTPPRAPRFDNIRGTGKRRSLVHEWEARAKEEELQVEVGTRKLEHRFVNETPVMMAAQSQTTKAQANGDERMASNDHASKAGFDGDSPLKVEANGNDNDNGHAGPNVEDDGPFDRVIPEEEAVTHAVDTAATSSASAPTTPVATPSAQPIPLALSPQRMSVIVEGHETKTSQRHMRFFRDLDIGATNSMDSQDKSRDSAISQPSMAGDIISLSHQMPGSDPTLRIQVHNDLIAWESKRRSDIMADLEYLNGEWKAAKDILAEGIEEVKIAERLVVGTSKAGMLFSASIQSIYEDKFLDNKGKTVTNSFLQNRLMHRRRIQEYTIDVNDGKAANEGQKQSALLHSIIESQRFIMEQFRENSMHMQEEILPYIAELRVEVEAAAKELELNGSRVLAEMKRSEMEINKIWDMFDGMVTGDLMEYSVHGSLHGSTHGSSLHGTANYGSSMHGLLTPRGDTESALGGMSTTSPILKGPLRTANVVEDGWLVETYYRSAVLYQSTLFDLGRKELKEVYGKIAGVQHKVQRRLQESMLTFVPRQRRLFTGLPEHFKVILEDLVGLRIDEETLEAVIDGSIKERSHTHLKSSYMHKSSIMNRSRLEGKTQETKIEDIEMVFGDPLESSMVRNKQLVELKPSVLGSLVNATWKTALIIVTSDGMMHVLEVPQPFSSSLTVEEAFNSLLPSDDLTTIQDWSQQRKQVVKRLTPFMTLNFSKSTVSVTTMRKSQIEIVEENKANTGRGSRFLLNAAQGQRGKKCVLRLPSPAEASEWLSVLEKVKEDIVTSQTNAGNGRK